jgi:hypothetical protein
MTETQSRKLEVVEVSTYRLIGEGRGNRNTTWGTKVIFADGWIVRLGRKVMRDEAIRLATLERSMEIAEDEHFDELYMEYYTGEVMTHLGGFC